MSIAQSFILTRRNYTRLNKEKKPQSTESRNILPVPTLINRQPIKDIEAALESNLDLV